jgi:hypothetical protein
VVREELSGVGAPTWQVSSGLFSAAVVQWRRSRAALVGAILDWTSRNRASGRPGSLQLRKHEGEAVVPLGVRTCHMADTALMQLCALP